MENLKIGFALTGSFCTLGSVLGYVRALSLSNDVLPIVSGNAAATDTRFMRAEELLTALKELTGKKPLTTIAEAEPIGPKKLLDLLIVAPCTGNTLAKIACGVTDTSVTMAVKAHLRNGKPVLLSVASNDSLSANAKNIGELLNRKNIYFVPFCQDDWEGKPCSLISDLTYLLPAADEALNGRQFQPLLLGGNK